METALYKTSMMFHVIICESEASAVAERLTEWTKGFESAAFQNEEKNKMDLVLVSKKIFLAVCPDRVQCTRVLSSITVDDVTFGVVRFEVSPCRTAVVVGICDAEPSARSLPKWVMDAMRHAVDKTGARCLTGVFGSCAKQMSVLARSLPMATGQPLAQEWKGATASDKQHAIRQVFPSYTLLCGNCMYSSFPLDKDIPAATIALENGYASAVADAFDVLPHWPPDLAAGKEDRDMEWGAVKMKKFDDDRWTKGIHQVAVWCGTAPEGRKARQKHSKNRNQARARKRKGGKEGQEGQGGKKSEIPCRDLEGDRNRGDKNQGRRGPPQRGHAAGEKDHERGPWAHGDRSEGDRSEGDHRPPQKGVKEGHRAGTQ